MRKNTSSTEMTQPMVRVSYEVDGKMVSGMEGALQFFESIIGKNNAKRFLEIERSRIVRSLKNPKDKLTIEDIGIVKMIGTADALSKARVKSYLPKT